MANRTHKPVPTHPDMQLDSQQRAWNGRFPIDLVQFRHRRFDGTMSGDKTWEVWRRGPAAAVLPYDPDCDAVVLIEQFRLPALVAGLDPVLVELPAGLVDDGETAEQTARREMQEEMALSVGELMRIGSFLLTPGGADELCELYVGRVVAPACDAQGIAGHAGAVDEHEDIRVRVWPAAKAIDAALNGEFCNSVTAIGLLWLASRREQVRTAWRSR
jgi:ADP-ribose pyrophosphatase